MAEENKTNSNQQATEYDRFKGLSDNLRAEIQQYEILYFKEDLPIPFGYLKIYPVCVKDYEQFLTVSSCLTLNKNETLEGIRMTYLDFLVSKTKDKKEGAI